MSLPLRLGSLATFVCCTFLLGMASADPLPATTRLVSAATAPTPTEENFTIAASEDLVVTLTDFQVPAALSFGSVIVTQGGTLVGDATLAPPATSATIAIPAAAGAYTLRVIGAPNADFSVGTFSVCVAPKTDPTNCIQDASLAGNITAQSSISDPTVSTFSIGLTVVEGGTYTVTFVDDKFPALLASAPNLALFQGSSAVSLGIASGTSLTLAPGSYTLLSVAQADPTSKAGLYGITITGPAGAAALLDVTLPVGTMGAPIQVDNSSTQSATLSVTDFAFPSALASTSVSVTAGGAALALASPTTPATFQAPAGTLAVWTYGVAGSDAGTYEVDLKAGATSLLTSAYAVSNGTAYAYAFVTASIAAGNYQASGVDFEFPVALQALRVAVAQDGVILQQSAAAGSLNFSAAAGPVILLVDATPPVSGNGLFDVNVQSTDATPQLLFDQTQGVGAGNLFDAQNLTLGVAGDFNVTLTDLMFPSAFQNLALVVSKAGVVVGKIFGGGSFPMNAGIGTYQLTFIATPATQQQYGLYALQIANAAPTLTLTATPTSVASGGSTTLTWTSTDATSCMASGGSFAGPQAVTGTVSVSVTITTSFSLTCSGAGGDVTESVSVTATAASSSGGGGGAADARWLFALAILTSLNLFAKARKRK